MLYPILVLVTLILGAFGLAAFLLLNQLRKKRTKIVALTAQDILKEGEESIKCGFATRKVPSDLDAIVIGSGMGGLTTAAFLARQGKKVLVLEQHDVAGGCTHTFMEKGYEFDTGLHYVGAHVGTPDGPPSMGRELMYSITDGMVEWAPMDDSFDVAVFGSTLDNTFETSGDVKVYKQRLKERFPEEEKAIEAYFSLVFETVKFARPLFTAPLLPTALAGLMESSMAGKRAKYVDRTVDEVLRSLTSNELLQNLLAYPFGDYGLPPTQATWVIHALVVHHYFGGAFYPKGGSSQIAKAVAKVIEKAGGKILVRAPVAEIHVDSGKVTGVSVLKSGERHMIRAPLVISSAGARNTFLKLISKEHAHLFSAQVAALKEQEFRPSSQHISLYVGLKGTKDELKLPNRNYWCLLTPNKPQSQVLDEYMADPADPISKDIPLAFVSFPSAKDPTWDERVGADKQVALLITEAKYEWFAKWADERVKHRGADYQAIKKSYEEKLMTVLLSLFPHLKDKVDYVEVATPLSSSYYLATPHGESYGLAHTPGRFAKGGALFGPHTPIQGLYLSGQDVTSAGIFGALAGGFFCACAVSKSVVWDNLNLFAGDIAKATGLKL